MEGKADYAVPSVGGNFHRIVAVAGVRIGAGQHAARIVEVKHRKSASDHNHQFPAMISRVSVWTGIGARFQRIEQALHGVFQHRMHVQILAAPRQADGFRTEGIQESGGVDFQVVRHGLILIS